jgi:hypothetical protein
MPDSTTAAAAIATLPSSIVAMAMAKGVVTKRGSTESRTVLLATWIKRTYNAVPNNPPTEETTTEVRITGRLSFTSFLRAYIGMENETTEAPSMKRSRSPAPSLKSSMEPDLNGFRTSVKDRPMKIP